MLLLPNRRKSPFTLPFTEYYGGNGYYGPQHYSLPASFYGMGAAANPSGYLQPPPPPPGSSSGLLSRGSSRDDLTSMGDSCGQVFEYEDRFRVDRKKLEMLMMDSFPPIPEGAREFFGRIEEETGTVVIWPTRLKIGAKSKKGAVIDWVTTSCCTSFNMSFLDPHIRVGGNEFGVKAAKSRILSYFETKSNRVTMKMDVSYTDHSHIIGKGGNTIRRVMAETNCHIHFPDSNRSNPNEKSNQVL